MHSKPLSSDQALDDYFFDLLEESNEVAVSAEIQDPVLDVDKPSIENVEVAPKLLQPKLNEFKPQPKVAVDYAEPSNRQDIERLLSKVDENYVDDIQENVVQTANPQQIVSETEQVIPEQLTSIKEVEPTCAENIAEDTVETEVTETATIAEDAVLIPPEQWTHHGMEQAFQALFFEVNGVTFAVALTELGGIHQLGDLNRLLGRPSWYLGLQSTREQKLDVVDTARWVMPKKLVGDEYRDNYRYIVMLGDSQWGLASDKLHGTKVLNGNDIRWREKAGKRPWLAGMVKDKMCALIHVNALIAMLNNGLDVNSIE
ncbi:chemotaxis protein CheW [Photobacterium angustum]|uniref:Chemotaxis protein CheW n=1 Tax=Photobacterium angustum TaxID=661 RepID=A0ABX5HA01_PHOAN|nr:chemotaxis protein CheW [Photobacterium angustum]KJG40342.1 chemotaxis protein CheW [Photobacterium angustum]PSX12512.1 chemotaxis protein CheW [Photobacterium angustum]